MYVFMPHLCAILLFGTGTLLHMEMLLVNSCMFLPFVLFEMEEEDEEDEDLSNTSFTLITHLSCPSFCSYIYKLDIIGCS